MSLYLSGGKCYLKYEIVKSRIFKLKVAIQNVVMTVNIS